MLNSTSSIYNLEGCLRSIVDAWKRNTTVDTVMIFEHFESQKFSTKIALYARFDRINPTTVRTLGSGIVSLSLAGEGDLGQDLVWVRTWQ